MTSLYPAGRLAPPAEITAGHSQLSTKRGLPLVKLVSPGVVLLGPVLFSLVAWCIPGGDELSRGFNVRSPVTLTGVVMLAVWYASCWLCLRAGLALVRGFVAEEIRPEQLRGRQVDTPSYVCLSLLATIGVAYSYMKIASVVSIPQLLGEHQANLLHDALPANFGIQTLRYASALSAAVALHRIWLNHRIGLLSAWNLVLIAATALLSSRLSLILAVVVFAHLASRSHPDARISLRAVILWTLIVFAALVPLTYSRTAGTYGVAGISNPAEVALLQVESYLGTPMQVELGLSNAIASEGFHPASSGPVAAVSVLSPTYFQRVKVNTDARPDSLYGRNVDISVNYTTNSAFADVYALYGAWGLLYALFAIFLAGALYAVFDRYDGVLICGSGVVLYGLGEVWRVFLFDEGILHFLLMAIIASSIIALILRRYGGQSALLAAPGKSLYTSR